LRILLLLPLGYCSIGAGAVISVLSAMLGGSIAFVSLAAVLAGKRADEGR
jgi:hypothetical protein